MKPINDHNHNNNGSHNNNYNNWLGFSLSAPHMKMEVTSSSDPHHHYNHQQAQASSASAQLPSSFYNLSPLCYENGGFHSPLTVMPLKSDGSLCIMEALTRSQTEGMVPNSSPKLEDFLGGASMGAHDYGAQQREVAMALSLDSLYYNENTETEQHYYSGIPFHGAYQAQMEEESSKQAHIVGSDSHQMTQNWVTRQYSAAPHTFSQQQMSNNSLENGGGSGSVNGGMQCGDLQSLTLSMSPGSQSSCVTAPRQISPTETECLAIETKKRGSGKLSQTKQPVHRKSIDTFGQRTSQYRGVTRHRWTGRYEAHLWDNSCKKEGQTRKGRQGGYDMEEKAARAYDLAALKYWGSSTHINFPLEDYTTQIEEMKNMNRQEYVAHLRRKSSGFSRGASIYRGVTRHHQHGRWQARIGRVAGNKDLYLGTFATQEEAAEAYDIAAIKFRGVNAVTNFDITRYDVEKIMASNTLLAGEFARRNKEVEPNKQVIEYSSPAQNNVEASPPETSHGNSSDWKMALFQAAQQQQETAATYVQTLDQKSMSSGNYRSPATFSMALQDLIRIESVNSSQQLMDESAKAGAQFSNPSSLVTSLSSSREDSPDKSAPTMLFAKPPMASKFISPSTAVSSWFPSAQLRPAASISMSQLPLFAAWSDT
ncbi:hypothetical protein ACLB2K_009951 [Fragaria x ananassa]